MKRLKIGAVSYLNTKPLVHGLDALKDEVEVIYDLPSRLADRLAARELDVALIPSIEATHDPRYVIVSDACIGCQGPVWSVKLLSKLPHDQIKTLALDEGSRTSAALTKILLAEKFNCRPELQSLPIDADWQETETDAVLLIGDRAMKLDKGPHQYVWDLGEVWHEWTGMPFVFAMWTALPSPHLDRLGVLLTQARDRGIEYVTTIADSHADSYNLTIEQCRHYLMENLHFFLGGTEKEALREYYRFAAKNQLIPENTSLKFHECQPT